MLQGFSGGTWLAVLGATLAQLVLGWLWFVALFGKVYATALGRPYDKSQKPAPIFIVGPLVCGLVVTVTNAALMHAMKVTTLPDALAFGAFVGFGYLAATTVNVGINPNMPRPLLYGLVSGGYFFVGNLVGCGILATAA